MIYYIYSLGLIPFFSLRAITPIFATALFARLAPGWEPVAQELGVQLAAGLPQWMSNDTSLTILFLAALAENFAGMSKTYREVMLVVQPAIRGFAAFFLCFNLVEGDFTELLQIISEEGLTTGYVWGSSSAYTWSFLIGWATWFGATARASVQLTLIELDPEDDLKLQAVIHWLESSLSFTGGVIVMLSPVLGLITGCLTIGGIYLTKAYLANREERKKVPCHQCGTPRHLCGVWCDHCRSQCSPVHKVGLMGLVKRTQLHDYDEHHNEMLLRKRCYWCGERYKERSIIQRCNSCQRPPFHSKEELDVYRSWLSKRLGKTLGICALYGLFPVFGLIPGILYYRLNLISGIRGYLPTSSGCFGRWVVRFFILTLMMAQGVPALGPLALPLMCLINYSVYLKLLQSESRKMRHWAPQLS